MKRKIIPILLIVLFVILLCPISVFAANENILDPQVSYSICPSCANTTLANLGHKTSTWFDVPTQGSFDHPQIIEGDHTHKYIRCYFLERCSSCGYADERAPFVQEYCSLWDRHVTLSGVPHYDACEKYTIENSINHNS